MKNLLLLGCLISLVLLVGCTNKNENSSPFSIGTAPYNCFTPDYYENVIIDKQVSFIWDEGLSAYTVEIPELCVKFIATKRNKELDLFTRKESPYLEEKEISIKNNSLFMGGYKYRFLDKEATETLNDTIQKKFRIRFEDNDIRTYQDQTYCIIAKGQPSNLYARPQIDGIADEDTHYTLIRPIDINESLAVKDFRYYVSHHCGALYPIQEEEFDRTRPYGILYTDKNPTRYFFYPEVIGQNLDFHLFANITLQYLD